MGGGQPGPERSLCVHGLNGANRTGIIQFVSNLIGVNSGSHGSPGKGTGQWEFRPSGNSAGFTHWFPRCPGGRLHPSQQRAFTGRYFGLDPDMQHCTCHSGFLAGTESHAQGRGECGPAVCPGHRACGGDCLPHRDGSFESNQ